MKITFDTNRNERQKDVCRLWGDHTTTDIVYGGSKGSGKSYLGCSLIFGDALMYPGTHYFIARDSLTSIRKFTIPSIHEVFTHWGIGDKYYSYNGQDNYYQLHNESRVYLLDAKHLPSDPLFMRFGSMQMTRGWIEEAGEFAEAAKNNLGASIGRWKNDVYNLSPKLLQTCNPAKNYLYRDYYKPHKENRLPDWKKFVQALPSDNKKLPDGYLENLQRILSTNEKERLLKGNWEYDDDPAAMLSYNSILDIFTNSHVPPGKSYITADIARFGKDTTVIRVWSGWRCIKRVCLVKSSITNTAETIKALANTHGVPMSRVLVDEDGVGGGVKDILGCKGFVNNSSPLKGENFDHLKSQCAFKLAEIINGDNNTPPGVYEICTDPTVKERIIEEMEQLKQRNMDKDLKKAIVRKEDMIEMLGRSPDDLDTYIMRAWFDLVGEWSGFV